MAIIKALGLVLSLLTAVQAAPGTPENPALASRQSAQPHWYKYWANANAVVESENLSGGVFSVDWNEPNGGNFVIGKGFQTGRNT